SVLASGCKPSVDECRERVTQPALAHVDDGIELADAELLASGHEHTSERVARLVGERGEHVEFGVDLCWAECRFERAEFVEPPLDVLVSTLPEFVFEVSLEPFSRLCHGTSIDYRLN